MKALLFLLMCIVFVSSICSSDTENASAKVYTLDGKFVGYIYGTPSSASIELKQLGDAVVTTAEGVSTELTTGMYIFAPVDFYDQIPFFGQQGPLGFNDATASTLPFGIWDAGDIEMADLDSDGRPDIVFSMNNSNCDSILFDKPRVWMQTDIDIFLDESFRIPSLSSATHDIELFDIDMDGDIDIMVGGYYCAKHNSPAFALINDGNGFFLDQSLMRLPPVNAHSFVYYVEDAKVDNNNSPDLIVNIFNSLNPNSRVHPEIWLNNGAGYFFRDTSGRMPSVNEYGFFDLVVSDIDNDSLDDILFANFSQIIVSPGFPDPIDTLWGGPALFRNNGDGYFVDETFLRLPEGKLRRTRDIAVADVDLDGNRDILDIGLLYGTNVPLVRLLMNDGTGSFLPLSGTIFDTLYGWFNDSEFALVNEDNLPDLFMTNVDIGMPDYDRLLINNTGGMFENYSGLLPSVLDFSVSASVFDHQFDGDVDIMVGNSGAVIDQGGHNVLYQNLLRDNTEVRLIFGDVPFEFELFQNYPNPFNGSTKFTVHVPSYGLVNLTVYDLLGREIETIVNETLAPGVYSKTWDTGSLQGGVYFYRLNAGLVSQTKKMVLIK